MVGVSPYDVLDFNVMVWFAGYLLWVVLGFVGLLAGLFVVGFMACGCCLGWFGLLVCCGFLGDLVVFCVVVAKMFGFLVWGCVV